MGSLDVWGDRVDPLVGSMLGKDYRVIEPIGFGGMAVVYLVEHQTLRKRFAAKVLSVELAANLEARARFEQEAHAASQLDHENIVNISDFGVTVDQRPFFVMELLRGQTLDQRVAEAAMSIEEVVAVAVPVARALAHAHAEGIVHRDVKPENVFLVQRSQGRFGIKVMDFGIAKTPVNSRLTKMGETLGSPMFMAPEACRGEDVDHRADVYSFGTLLYLMLCGRVPFQDDNLLRVLQMQVSEPLPPPRSVNPEVSPELAQVIERALAKDPGARYLSMDALLIDLEAAVPQGSDRLLVEAQTGGASSFRITAFSGAPGQRSDSQRQLARIGSQPLPAQSARPQPAAGSAARAALPATTPSRFGMTGHKRWLIAPPALGIVAIGGWLLLRGRGVPAHEARPATAPQHSEVVAAPTSAAPSPAPKAASATAAAAPVPAGPHTVSPLASTVHLRVTTTPPEATVDLEGKRLGATPLDVELPRRDGEAQLVISHDGFTEVKQRLDLSDDSAITLALPPLGRPARIAKRPLPPPPTARPLPAGRGSGSAGPGSGSSAPKGDPDLDIRLSR